MKIRIFIFINKLVTFICKLFKRQASVYPGYIVYDIFKQKKILESVKYPNIVIAVTGSSGKGSTTDYLYHILTDHGYDVCYNKNGSNGVLAATTLILNNCDFKGKFLHDVLLLECDERHLKLIFGKNKMTHLVITNITRDQPARNGHPDLVLKDIKEAIGDNTKLILNADDPAIKALSLEFNNEVITYGVAKTKDSYVKTNIEALDYAYCPKCHKKLIYDYYHYGHIGKYHCPTCDFKRNDVNYEVSKVDYKNHCIKINENDIYLNKDVLYAVYYTVAAICVASTLGISFSDIVKSINKDKLTSKRGKVLEIDSRKLTMLETKNENNLSYYQSIRFIKNQRGKKTIILGFDNVSRRYHFNDLSWLWDVDFELLNDKNIDKIFVFGRFKYNIATRLEFAGIEKKKIVFIDDASQILDIAVQKTKGDIYTMIWYDMVDTVLSKVGA